jgi:hypothetical protein
MKTRALLLTTAAALVLFAAPAFAQQPAPEGQRQDETPTLTTDDVTPVPIAGQPAGAQTDKPAAEDDSKLTPEERADSAAAKGKGDAKGPAKKKGPSAAELQWRAQYAQAEAQMLAARQQAQEAELKLTELRNRLGTTGTVADRNQLAVDIKEQGENLRQAQAAADAAEASYRSIKAAGASKNFKPAAGPAPQTASGAANPNYYSDRFAKAQAAFDDADRRVQIYQDRVSDVRGRILNNSGSGDQFSGMKLQEELDAALTQLDKATTDRAAAETELDAARQEALANGVNVPR